MTAKNLGALVGWIGEREVVRLRREAGEPKPWTDDPILRECSFCNVRREEGRPRRRFDGAGSLDTFF